MSNPLVTQSPTLLIKEVSDIILRKNFQNLSDYFQANNQLLGFSFFEYVFTKAQANVLIGHGLKTPPLDIIITQVSGPGQVTFNYGLFDKSNLNISSSDACRVRFFAGTYYNQVSAANTASTDAWVQGSLTSASAASAATTASTAAVYWGQFSANPLTPALGSQPIWAIGGSIGPYFPQDFVQQLGGPVLLTDKINTNFGTVAALLTVPPNPVGQVLPGIVFNWPSSGYYQINAKFTGYQPTNGTIGLLYLMDASQPQGAVMLAQGNVFDQSSTPLFPVNLEGIIKVTAAMVGKQQIIKLMGSTHTGSNVVETYPQATCTLDMTVAKFSNL